MALPSSAVVAWDAFSLKRWAEPALTQVTKVWFGVTFTGQFLFAAYVILFYGSAALRGHFEAWNKVMGHGHVHGDSAGNAATGVHLLVAALIMLSGALQLVPRLRSVAPSFHRWNGRAYLVSAILGSMTGIYMVWWRGAAGDVIQHVATTLNGVLVLVCAVMALQTIRARQIAAHKRWALRLFFAVSGVWYFRVGLMFWIAVNRGPVGFDPATFQGPFLQFLAFAQYLLPIALLELYALSRSRGPVAQLAMTLVLAGATLASAIGIAVATFIMWMPNM